MDRFLNALGWKIGDKWDKEEVAVDIAICSTTMLVICFITCVFGG